MTPQWANDGRMAEGDTSLYVKKGQVQVVGLFRSFIKSLSSRSNSQHMFEQIKLSEADSESVR